MNKIKHLHLFKTEEQAIEAWKQFKASYHRHDHWRELSISRYTAFLRCSQTMTDFEHHFICTENPKWHLEIAGIEYAYMGFACNLMKEDIDWALTRLRGEIR